MSLNSDWAFHRWGKVEIRGRLDLEDGEKINFDSDRIWMETNGLQLFHSNSTKPNILKSPIRILQADGPFSKRIFKTPQIILQTELGCYNSDY